MDFILDFIVSKYLKVELKKEKNECYDEAKKGIFKNNNKGDKHHHLMKQDGNIKYILSTN